MKEAKLEAAFVAGLDTQFGRDLEHQHPGALSQFGGGEIAPGELETAEHDDLDAQDRLL